MATSFFYVQIMLYRQVNILPAERVRSGRARVLAVYVGGAIEQNV